MTYMRMRTNAARWKYEILVCRCFAGRLSASPQAFIASRRRAPSSSFLCLPFANPGLRHAKRKDEKRKKKDTAAADDDDENIGVFYMQLACCFLSRARARFSLLLSAGFSRSMRKAKKHSALTQSASALRPTPRAEPVLVAVVFVPNRGEKHMFADRWHNADCSDLRFSSSSATNPTVEILSSGC